MQEWYLHCIKNSKRNWTYFFGTLSGGASDDRLLFKSESVGIADVSESGFASGLPGRTKIFCKKSSTNNKENAIQLLKTALCKSLNKFIEDNELNFEKWRDNVEKIKNEKTREKIKNMINKYDTLIKSDNENKEVYEKLFFSNLFLSYAENKKGEVALEILLNNELIDKLIIPQYIKEGIEWLMK